MHPETIALHGGFAGDPATRAVAVPIYQTVAYSFESAAHGAALFDLEAEGFRYTRIGNPTVDVLERRVAMLEGGVDALAVASGQTAMYYTMMNLADAGQNIVSVPQLYGTTHTLFAHILPRQGIEVRLAKSDRPAELAALIDAGTRALFCETVGNPAGNICDLEALAEVAHRARMPLMVDNTVATPSAVRPIDYGADIVVHSLTKFLGGHGTTPGRHDRRQRPVPLDASTPARFPMLTEPDASYHGLVYTEHYGDEGISSAAPQRVPAHAGRGTLALQRIPAAAGHRDGRAADRAARRERAPGGRVSARGPARRLGELRGLRRQPVLRAGAEVSRRARLLADDVRRFAAATMPATRFYDALGLFRRLVNLGDAKSLACHPASTTHRQMSPEEQRAGGRGAGDVRLSVGIEHIDDILEDLDQALAVAAGGSSAR